MAKLRKQEFGSAVYHALEEGDAALLFALAHTHKDEHDLSERVGYEEGDEGGDGGTRSYGGFETWFDHGDRIGHYGSEYWFYVGETALHFAMDLAKRARSKNKNISGHILCIHLLQKYICPKGEGWKSDGSCGRRKLTAQEIDPELYAQAVSGSDPDYKALMREWLGSERAKRAGSKKRQVVELAIQSL